MVEANYDRHDVTWKRSVLLVKTNNWMIYILFNDKKLKLILKIAAFWLKRGQKGRFLASSKNRLPKLSWIGAWDCARWNTLYSALLAWKASFKYSRIEIFPKLKNLYVSMWNKRTLHSNNSCVFVDVSSRVIFYQISDRDMQFHIFPLRAPYYLRVNTIGLIKVW